MEKTGFKGKDSTPLVEVKERASAPAKEISYGTPECIFPNVGPKGWCRTHGRACITPEQYEEKIRKTLERK